MSEEKEKKQSEWRQREVGAFWKREYKNGEGTYLAGHIVLKDEFGAETKQKVVLFSNRDKPSEKAPDFKLYRSKEYRPDDSSNTESQASDSSPAPQAVGESQTTDEEIL